MFFSRWIHSIPRSVLFASLAILAAGCGLQGPASPPTPYPAEFLPTIIYLTARTLNATKAARATPTVVPTDSPTVSPQTPSPTLIPTLGPDISLSAIQIAKPGPMSKVASPLELSVLVYPGRSNRMQVDLYGEDGSKLYEDLLAASPRAEGDLFFIKIPFEIRAAGELGLIQVSTKDEFGRIQSLVTQRVLLIANGDTILNPPGNSIYEHVGITGLPQNSTVSGGVMSLEGVFLPYNRQPFVIELITNDGKSLVTKLVDVSGLGPQSFSVTLPYKVEVATQARLFVRQADDILNGPAYIYSEPLTLEP